MNILYLISSIYVIVFIIGVVLSVYYLYIEKGIPDWKEFLYVLFFAPIGYGNWKYNHVIRSTQIAPHSKDWYIYTFLIRINWCIVVFLLIYEMYSFYHFYHLLVRYNEIKDTAANTVGSITTDILYSSFGWMIDTSIYIVIGFMTIVLLFSFIACFILFILLPKLLIKRE